MSYSNGHLIVQKDDDNCEEIFLDNVSNIIIDSLEISLTTYLINEFRKRKITVLLTDEKKNPSMQIVPLYGSYECSNNLFEQMKWTNQYKENMWGLLLKDKLIMQSKLLKYFGLDDRNIFGYYISRLTIPDYNNIEGTLAKVYFRLLFGDDFIRREDSVINSALNYGYAILLSYINKVIINYGYKTEIGYNHCSKTNEFNLSCDFIEPFRPFIDRCVSLNKNRELDLEYKKCLVNILYEKVRYNEKEYELRNLIPIYIKERIGVFSKVDITRSDIDFV